MNERPVKDRLTCLFEGAILINAALVYAVAGLAPQTFVGVVVGVALALAIGRPLPRSSRTVVYGAVATLLLTTLESQVFQTRDTRLFLPQANIYCPLLLYGGTVMLFYAQGRLIPPLITSVGLLVLLLAGSTLGNPPVDPWVPLQGDIAGQFKATYRVATVVQLVAMVALFHRRWGWGGRGKSFGAAEVVRRGLILAALGVVFFASLGLERLATSFEPKVNRWYTRLIELTMRRRARQVMFDSQVDLWRTVDVRDAQDRTVVLRVVSPSRPGYFRGRIYDHYQRGRWSAERQAERLLSWPADGFKSYTIFSRPLPTVDFVPEHLSIFSDVVLQTDILFVPGTASRFEIVAETLSSDSAGMVAHSKWEQRAGYRVVRRQASGHAAYPMPRGGTADFSAWLEVPERLQRELTPFAEAAFSAEPRSDAVRMREVVAYLNAHCEYALGTPLERFSRRDRGEIDPVMQFLAIQRQGHCELFATAAAMLLRREGIPARYVTGFICAEMASGYWVARLEHAHAWVEAYDRQRGQWLLVEATPPSGMPSEQPRFGWLTGLIDGLRMGWRQFMALIRRGEFAAVIAWVVVAIWRHLVGLAGSTWFWSLCALAGLFAMAISHRRRRRRWQTNPQLAMLDELLAGFERALGRKKLHRAKAETLCEFRRRLLAATPASEPLCAWLEDYELLRYNPQARTSQTLAALQERRRRLRSVTRRL